MSVNDEVRDLAARTAAEIRRRGWIQGRLYKRSDGVTPTDYNNCSVCLAGGILAAEGKLGSRQNLDDIPAFGWELLYQVAVRRCGHPDPMADDAIDWNDRDGRTVETVLEVLDEIAGDK